MPAFFAANKYRNPTDSLKTPLQQAFNTDKHFFDEITERNLLPTFQTLMTAWRADRADFLDIYPAEERLVKGHDVAKPFFVDVGGGHGHEIQKVREKFSDIPAESFVLQDQKDILAEVKGDGMQVMQYDFFTPQPVKGNVQTSRRGAIMNVSERELTLHTRRPMLLLPQYVY